MTFEEKVTIVRNLPQFRVAPISEVRAIAFAAKTEANDHDLVLSKEPLLALTNYDIEQILHEYPHLETLLNNV